MPLLFPTKGRTMIIKIRRSAFTKAGACERGMDVLDRLAKEFGGWKRGVLTIDFDAELSMRLATEHTSDFIWARSQDIELPTFNMYDGEKLGWIKTMGARFSLMSFLRANFSGATLGSTVFNLCDMYQSNLDATKAEGLRLQSCDARSISLDNAKADRFSMWDCRADGSMFREAIMRRSFFSRSSLRDVHVHKADMEGATFEDTDLSGSYFSGANLRGARFVRTNLSYANLSESDLSLCTFVDCDITGFVLHEAKAHGVRGIPEEVLIKAGASVVPGTTDLGLAV